MVLKVAQESRAEKEEGASRGPLLSEMRADTHRTARELEIMREEDGTPFLSVLAWGRWSVKEVRLTPEEVKEVGKKWKGYSGPYVLEGKSSLIRKNPATPMQRAENASSWSSSVKSTRGKMASRMWASTGSDFAEKAIGPCRRRRPWRVFSVRTGFEGARPLWRASEEMDEATEMRVLAESPLVASEAMNSAKASSKLKSGAYGVRPRSRW
jgi:hypothetical protein